MTTKDKHSAPPVKTNAAPGEPAEMSFQILSCDLIDDPEQPIRTELTPENVQELVLSIKQVGIIEPLVVKPTNDRYEVIAGHRRLYACKLARIPEVACYIRRANNEQTEMLKIHENLYREDIKPADEAKHFSYLINKQKMTPSKIAQIISKAPSYVTDRLDILNYPDFLRLAMDNGEISFSVAREFARLDDLKQMRSSIYYAKRGGMTQEMARRWVNDFFRQRENPTIQETTTTNGETGKEETEYTSFCVYCEKGLRLVDAEVVYMHHHCLKEVSTKPPQTKAVV